MTFRWFSLLVFAAILGGIGLHSLLFPFSASGRWTFREIIRTKIHALTLLLLEQKLSIWGRFRKLICLLALLAFAVLFLTGFGPLFFGCRLSSWLLMIHATFAPILAVCLVVLAFGWASAMVFCGRSDMLLKLCFWLLLVLSLPLALSMVLSMFRWFGTDGQKLLLELHRWCALAFGSAAFLFLYLLIRRQIKMENQEDAWE
jgi:hypothetical protein